MPRFSETEKERIKQKLLIEGERLFTAHGLRKVTIDDLVAAANIAKASFYKFYDGKEYLYLDIVQAAQADIFTSLEKVLDENKAYSAGERVKQVFLKMYELMLKYPILSQINAVNIEMISRKVSEQRFEEFTAQNVDAVNVLVRHGIPFAYDTKTVSTVFGALYGAWISLQDEGDGRKKQVIDIMLDGIIEQVVVSK
jgi:AcrR family transcriptional regulator